VSDLVEFLRARLDEEERAAKEQPAEWAADWAKYLVDPVIGPFGGQSRLRNVATGFYVAGHSDPARVLADVAAKREVLDGYAELYEHADVEEWSTLNWVVRLMAAVYSDHPDYQQEWA
jgi:hypothetical protein